ncbi:uncharacterized protein (DUF305 family) [Krasilnikovia cinnamomea]|uniref:Uncharacterized protein (DUF305 family) n=1 Tax=Krasilnikovia cinnamomea TaxID=349313 RepID=A0A4Q7ZEQ8_9ACTN|nr:DUF305 domain-containing protein [Krasilnikovia cinnamomea]RZU48449.1 uncharacterized protein (DUF305 family) [Krasilnikovia cinnamomea]
MLTFLVLTGCRPAAPAPAPAPTAGNATDVMFLQMSLAYADQGDQVAAVAEQRAEDPRVRALAARLRAEWRAESETMRHWLLRWQQPLTADPAEGAHAGHGDPHSLRAADLAELRGSRPADLDRTALTLLIGHLHNCVAVSRMESAGGGYPPARDLAAAITQTRQEEIRQMLQLVA